MVSYAGSFLFNAAKTVSRNSIHWKCNSSLTCKYYIVQDRRIYSIYTREIKEAILWRVESVYVFGYSRTLTVRVPERVRFWHEIGHLSANHSSASFSRRAVIGWEVYIFMPKSYTFRDFDGTWNKKNGVPEVIGYYL